MTITKVKVDSYAPKSSGICAEVTVVLDDILAIHKVSVVRGERGYFVAMPNTGHTKIYNSKKRFEDLVHPLNKGLTSEISDAVLEAYNKYKA